METINVLHTVNTLREFFSEAKDLFCFLCNKIPPKDAAGKQTFLHLLFLENKEQTTAKNMGDIFLLIENHTQKFRHF